MISFITLVINEQTSLRNFNENIENHKIQNLREANKGTVFLGNWGFPKELWDIVGNYDTWRKSLGILTGGQIQAPTIRNLKFCYFRRKGNLKITSQWILKMFVFTNRSIFTCSQRRKSQESNRKKFKPIRYVQAMPKSYGPQNGWLGIQATWASFQCLYIII